MTVTHKRPDADIITLPPRPGEQPQHLQALVRANIVRLARAELGRRLKAGEITAGAAIVYQPWWMQSMAVAGLLKYQARWGQNRVRKFLAKIPLSETKAIGSLTKRQRDAIVKALPHSKHSSDTPGDPITILNQIEVEARARALKLTESPKRRTSTPNLRQIVGTPNR